ncbi:MAG TPA: integrase arm-type DNA-binding domain-containing protein, partial [Pseudolabrys sp.]|nr:integrase arm-type DNA-binding domain-containing protein [Pseudolabrys sp.]
MSLSSFSVEKAKPRDKPYKLSDGDGLHLLINPNGSKLWRFRYRFGGKQKMIGFGSFPEVSLAAARDKRDEARKLVAAGIDPSQKRREDKRLAAVSAANTFAAIATELIEKLKEEGIAEQTGYKKRWLLLDLGKPLADRPIKDITPAEILDLLRVIEKTGRRETAHRLRAAIGQVFRYGIATLRCETDPTLALRGALKTPIVRHRAALTDEQKVGALWASINEYDGWPTLKAALQLAMLTMARPTEVRHMRKRDVNFMLAKWTIPAQHMKMRLAHDVPLSRQAIEVLRNVWDLFPQSEYVLPSIRTWKRPLSENAMNSAL